jgi:hypothetical protein
MASTDGTLMVTENSDLSVTVIVKLDFLLNADVLCAEFFEKSRHGEGSIVGTEHLGTKTRHVVCQMLVKLAGLTILAEILQVTMAMSKLTLRRSKISSPSFFGDFLKIFKFLKT